ncbi:hypothetical protein SDC9_180275 [bioreactor metagenome]|uniref:Uncharacterized protein n=1 Tax=bioreactor metagenome TaxID=1076179 RepID=A0A645H184_9ZZZZ
MTAAGLCAAKDQGREADGEQAEDHGSGREFHVRFLRSVSAAADKCQPVALLERGAFAAEHLVAVAPEPLLDLGRIVITPGRNRQRHRVDVLAGQRLARCSGIVAVTGGAGRRIRLSQAKAGDMQLFTAGCRKAGKRRIGRFGFSGVGGQLLLERAGTGQQ